MYRTVSGHRAGRRAVLLGAIEQGVDGGAMCRQRRPCRVVARWVALELEVAAEESKKGSKRRRLESDSHAQDARLISVHLQVAAFPRLHLHLAAVYLPRIVPFCLPWAVRQQSLLRVSIRRSTASSGRPGMNTVGANSD